MLSPPPDKMSDADAWREFFYQQGRKLRAASAIAHWSNADLRNAANSDPWVVGLYDPTWLSNPSVGASDYVRQHEIGNTFYDGIDDEEIKWPNRGFRYSTGNINVGNRPANDPIVFRSGLSQATDVRNATLRSLYIFGWRNPTMAQSALIPIFHGADGFAFSSYPVPPSPVTACLSIQEIDWIVQQGQLRGTSPLRGNLDFPDPVDFGIPSKLGKSPVAATPATVDDAKLPYVGYNGDAQQAYARSIGLPGIPGGFYTGSQSPGALGQSMFGPLGMFTSYGGAQQYPSRRKRHHR